GSVASANAQTGLNAQATLTVVSNTGSADLTITNTHVGQFADGQMGAQYKIVVSNVGIADTSGQVILTDWIPPGDLSPVSINGSGWQCTQPLGPCTRGDPLPVGGSYPAVILTVNVDVGSEGNEEINSATVSGGSDSNPSNNTATDQVIISAIGAQLQTL